MALLAKLYVSGRTAERRVIEADATLRQNDQVPVDVLVADLSTTGCLFLCDTPLASGDEISIGIAGLGRHQARVVRSMDQRYGCTFLTPLTDADVTAASGAPGETIVHFPTWSFGTVPEEESLPVTRLPGPVRLVILIATVMGSWSALIALLSRLH